MQLTLTYLLLPLLIIWVVLLIMTPRRVYLIFLLGIGLFLGIGYLSLGIGFSIRIPSVHDKMEVLVYTVHNDRVHALVHPLGKIAEPIHIVFSIDPKTPPGKRMRKSFFSAVRAHEEKRHETKIIIDMRGYLTDLGEYQHEVPPPLPPKMPR